MEILTHKICRKTLLLAAISLGGILCMLAPLKSSAAFLAKPPNNLGLVGYWSFEDGNGIKATDFSGQSNAGTLTNMDAATDWVVGKRGKALSFDGSDDFLRIPYSSKIDFSGGTAFTYAFWMDTEGASFGDHGLISQFTNTPSNYSGFMLWLSGGINFYVNGGVRTSMSLPGAGWNHIVALWDGSNVKLYKNGVEQSSASYSTSPANGTADVILGLYYSNGNDTGGSSPGRHFSGLIDELRIYSRALSPAELGALYQQSSKKFAPGTTNNNGLVGYWSFEDGKGSTVTDFSGKGNTGTLTNMDTTADWVAGKRGKALDFDGSNDHVVIGGPSSIYGMTTDLSVFAWIKTTDIAWEAFSGGNADDGGWGLSSFSSIGGTGQLTPLTGGTWRTSGHSNVSDGEWHHVGYTLSSASGGTLQFYKDGVADGSVITSAGAHSDVGAAIRMGSEINSGGFPFTGQLDEARVYSRAITAAEVASLYQKGAISKLNISQNSISPNNLVFWHTFDGQDLNTTTSTDRGGSKNGTLSGGPVPTIGKNGQALRFDGVDDYVITSGVPAGLTGDVAITMAAWIKPKVVTASAVANIRGGYKYFGMLVGLPSSGSIGLEAGSCGAETAGGVIRANEWQHVAIVKTPGEIVASTSIYVNGVSQSLSAGPYGTCTPSFGGTIVEIGGGWDSATDYLFNGSIDDVRIYDKALSAAEVLQLYNQTK